MNVVIVDDDKLVCTSLKIILESDKTITVQAIGYDGSEAVTLYDLWKPDVLLMDIRMKQINGLEAAEQILKKDKQANILFLTTFSDDEYIIKALHIGVKGYLLKQDYESIIPALKAVTMNQSVFGTDIIEKLPSLMQKAENFDYETYGITEREYELIKKVAQGFSNKEIAEKLFLSEGTVRNYLSNILDKLSLRDRTQLAVFYYKKIEGK